MTNGQIEFIKNYTSLMSQVDKNDLEKVVRFCSLFKTDNVDLFRKFCNSSQSVDDIINIFAEKYDLNPQADIEKIMYIFIENSINNGVCYHLNSSANRSSILNIGLGTSSIGIKTEERSDYERLKEIASPELFTQLEPFHSDKEGSKVFYSNKPILKSHYGKMPEWIQELKRNSNYVDFGDELETKEFVDEILQKYNKKYNNKSRDLLILPFLGIQITESIIDEMLEGHSPKDIISFLYYHLLQATNECHTEHISGNSIISIDLENLNLYFSGRNGEIESISPHKRNDEEIQLSSEYDMKEVFIGNTGKMYSINDRENEKEYYFKPAISKSGDSRPYRAFIQEAAYRIQKLINPENAVICNTIEVDGVFGAIQEKIQVDSKKTQAFIDFFNKGEGQLTPDVISQIMEEYLVDFCLCNYDSHAKNFVIDQKGKLRGIDKEQSFRYIKEDCDKDMMFSNNYNKKYFENPPIYNTIFEQMKQGKISYKYLGQLRSRANLVERIPDSQYRQIFEQYAYGKAGNAEDAETLLNDIVDRKRNLELGVERLIDKIYSEFKNNKVAQTSVPTNPISFQDLIQNAIKSGVTIEDVKRYDRDSSSKQEEIGNIENRKEEI